MKTGQNMNDWEDLLVAIADGTNDQMQDQIIRVIGNLTDRMIQMTGVDPCGTYGCIAQNMMFRMANMNHKACALQLISEMTGQLNSMTNQTPH
jgi:hypothetical protein